MSICPPNHIKEENVMIGSQLENQPTTQGRILGTPFPYNVIVFFHFLYTILTVCL